MKTDDILTETMARTKKLSATEQRREFYELRRRICFEMLCDACGASREFVSLADAVLATGETMREIARRVERGEIHFLESCGGHLFVCRQSLAGKSNAGLSNFETQ